MANLNDIYAFDKAAFEEGVVVALGNGITVKVRSPQSAHSRATRKRLEAPYAALTRGGRELPEDIAENLLIQQMSQSLIMGWDGIEDDNGKPIPATPTNIEAVLRKYQFFRDDVGGVLANRDTYKAQLAEADIANL
jgi:hypothetical protein